MIRLLLAGFPCTQFSIAQKSKRITQIDFTADEFIEFRNTENWWFHISDFEKQIGEKLNIKKYEFAEGLQLFLNCLVAYDRLKIQYPNDKIYFLFENVASMKKEIKAVIQEIIEKLYGGTMTEINSALVSAQNRKRIYFTNFGDISQPEDKGILLKDILENGIPWQEKGYALTASYNGAVAWNTIERKQRTMIAEPVCIPLNEQLDKSRTLKAQYGKTSIANLTYDSSYGATMVAEPVCLQEQVYGRKAAEDGTYDRRYETRTDNKSGSLTGTNRQNSVAVPVGTRDVEKARTLTTSYKGHATRDFEMDIVTNGQLGSTGVIEPITISDIDNGEQGKSFAVNISSDIEEQLNISSDNKIYVTINDKKYLIYEVKDGLISIKDKQYPIKLCDGFYIIRKLTVTESMRLQTVPSWYIMPCSNTNCYKMLGNGWTCDIISHILSHIPKITSEEIEVLSLYDGMSCSQIALKNLNAKVNKVYAYEIDKYAIQTTMANFPNTIQLGDAFKVRAENWKLED